MTLPEWSRCTGIHPPVGHTGVRAGRCTGAHRSRWLFAAGRGRYPHHHPRWRRGDGPRRRGSGGGAAAPRAGDPAGSVGSVRPAELGRLRGHPDPLLRGRRASVAALRRGPGHVGTDGDSGRPLRRRWHRRFRRRLRHRCRSHPARRPLRLRAGAAPAAALAARPVGRAAVDSRRVPTADLGRPRPGRPALHPDRARRQHRRGPGLGGRALVGGSARGLGARRRPELLGPVHPSRDGPVDRGCGCRSAAGGSRVAQTRGQARDRCLGQHGGHHHRRRRHSVPRGRRLDRPRQRLRRPGLPWHTPVPIDDLESPWEQSQPEIMATGPLDGSFGQGGEPA